jgi:hypothetical protein
MIKRRKKPIKKSKTSAGIESTGTQSGKDIC